MKLGWKALLHVKYFPNLPHSEHHLVQFIQIFLVLSTKQVQGIKNVLKEFIESKLELFFFYSKHNLAGCGIGS